MTNITGRLNKIRDLSRGTNVEKEIAGLCDELQSEVKEGSTSGDPCVILD